MRFSLLFLSFACSLTSAAPASQTFTASIPGASTDPCAILGVGSPNTVEEWSFFNPSVPLDCFKEVPINQTLASRWLTYITGVTQFQSTLAYLKNPPSSYQYPAVDVLGQLETIGNNLAAGQYTNQFNFDADIANLFSSARDGHLKLWSPFSLTGYTIRQLLVSVSKDGIEIPQLYFFEDIKSPSADYTPSPIVLINGEDATEFLANFAPAIASLAQDKDASYNNAIFNPTNFYLNGWGNSWYMSQSIDFNNTVTYGFANGTSSTLPVYWATRSDEFQGLESPTQFYNSAVVGTAQGMTGEGPPPNTAAADFFPSEFGYPTPIANSTDGVISGYFLSDQPETAVLLIWSFAPRSSISFQSTVTDFLSQCKDQNKTKLIVDIRSNGGGSPSLAYDAFKQIFPREQIYNRMRLRDHPAMNGLGQIFTQLALPSLSQVVQNFPTQDSQSLYDKAVLETLNAQVMLKSPDGEPYGTWSSVYGPQNFNGDIFSEYFSYDFANVAEEFQSGIINITGYGNNSNPPAQVFASENITLLTDGACMSSCGVFGNLMIQNGNVSTVAIGGRPSTEQMAIIGGTQGAQDISNGVVATFVNVANNNGTGAGITPDETSAIKTLLEVPPMNQNLYGMNINFLDNMGTGTSDMPMQFNSTMANCRIFYTASDITNIASTWSKISSGNFTCIDGGSKPGQQPVPGQNGTAKVPNSATASTSVPASIGLSLLTLIAFVFF
jgi:hypothetical protein